MGEDMSDNQLNVIIGELAHAGQNLAKLALDVAMDLKETKTVSMPVAEEHIHQLEFLALEWREKYAEFRVALGLESSGDDDEDEE